MSEAQPVHVQVVQQAAPKPPMRGPVLREDEPRVKLRLRFNADGARFAALPSSHPGAEHLMERPTTGDPTRPFDVVVYADEVSRVQAMCETETASIAKARRSYDRKVREMIANAVLESKDPHDLPADRRDWTDAMRRVENSQGTLSVEGEFHATEGRGILPLLSCEVLDAESADLAPFGEIAVRRQAELARASVPEALDMQALIANVAAASAKATVEALIAAGVVKAPKADK